MLYCIAYCIVLYIVLYLATKLSLMHSCILYSNALYKTHNTCCAVQCCCAACSAAYSAAYSTAYSTVCVIHILRIINIYIYITYIHNNSHIYTHT